MTPQSGYTPSGGASYYDNSHPAATRGRTFYAYDAGGRIAGVYNWWDSYNSGTNTYSSAPIRANECTYELTGINRGLKTQNKYYNVSSGSWNLQRTESYGYDANLDYLTSANYGDGLSNATPSWTYDAAGNRASDSTNSGTWSYDNLNRMTASPNMTYTNDVLGNRTGKTPSFGYGWDDLNRMTSLTVGSATTNYAYRADGLCVSKSSSSGSTAYRYDGQMGIEDVERNSSSTITAITRYALGSRGIDAISRTTSSGTSIAYPLYDAHGNNVGMLTKSGSSWSLGDERTYDAWGQVRSGATTGDQKGRYCANFGHKQDDESGLVYMRARYYESTSGRFVSEDPGAQGKNWYSYCDNIPTCRYDRSGKDWKDDVADAMMAVLRDYSAVKILEGFVSNLTKKLVKLGAMEFLASVESVSVAYFQTGKAEFELDKTFLEAGRGGGSFAQSALPGIGLCLSGAGKVVFGYAMQQAAMAAFLILMSADKL